MMPRPREASSLAQSHTALKYESWEYPTPDLCAGPWSCAGHFTQGDFIHSFVHLFIHPSSLYYFFMGFTFLKKESVLFISVSPVPRSIGDAPRWKLKKCLHKRIFTNIMHLPSLPSLAHPAYFLSWCVQTSTPCKESHIASATDASSPGGHIQLSLVNLLSLSSFDSINPSSFKILVLFSWLP